MRRHIVDRIRSPILFATMCAFVLGALLLSALLSPRPLIAQEVAEGLQADDANEEIAYIDSSGFLRVFDYLPGPNPPRVEWYSLEGGYIDLALGDVNLDGDMEIIAIGGDTDASKNMGLPRLVVYDPVVADPNAPVDGRINGIPWAKLYERVLPANPRLIDSGNLLSVSPGDEIIYITEMPENDPDLYDSTQLTILSAGSSPADGRNWTEYVDRLTFNDEWSWLALGDIDNADLDEIILVDNDQGLLRLYRHILSDPIFERHNENNRWRGAVVGNFRNRSKQDIFAIRGAQHGFSSFWVFQYHNGDFNDDYHEWLEPAPAFIFTADVENSGGDEAFMLRNVPDDHPQARLISRDETGQTIIEDLLDKDNGYKAGAGGNVDNDPEDEVVIIRNNAIRIYLEPRAGNHNAQFNVSTNSRSIRIGDLDAAGFSPGPTFVAVPPTVNEELEQGMTGEPNFVTLDNATTNESLPFSLAIEGGASWVSVEADSFFTPASLTISFDPGSLLPGIYNSAIIVTSSNDQVANQPYRIPTTLTVLPGMTLSPNSVTFIYYPCDSPQETRAQTIAVEGGTGDNFSVQVVNVGSFSEPLDWVTISPASGALPGAFTATVDPTRLAAQSLLEADILVESDGNPPSRRIAPLYVFCAQKQISLPLIHR